MIRPKCVYGDLSVTGRRWKGEEREEKREGERERKRKGRVETGGR